MGQVLEENASATPMVYVDAQQMKAFAQGGATLCEGFSYTWENEDVVHIHTIPLVHAFGQVDKVAIVRERSAVSPSWDYRYVVVCGGDVSDSDVEVLCRGNEGYSPVGHFSIPSYDELYSRSKGLLEVGVLEPRHVVVVGLGSFGSHICIELTKAGVGHFSVFDFDRVEIHNLVRHTSTLKDLGRLKTDAVVDMMTGKNPYVKVDKYPVDINGNLNLLEEVVNDADLVVCATDNNASRFNLSRILEQRGVVGIYGGAITRAEGGHVFVQRPGGACYCCLVGNNWYDKAAVEMSSFKKARQAMPAYVSDEDVEAMVQVGLSADIEPLSNMVVKLALVELSRGFESGISSLEEELVFNYYIWANRRDNWYKSWAPLPNAGNRPTIMRWYGAMIPKSSSCALCGDSVKLDVAEDLQDKVDLKGLEDADFGLDNQ